MTIKAQRDPAWVLIVLQVLICCFIAVTVMQSGKLVKQAAGPTQPTQPEPQTSYSPAFNSLMLSLKSTCENIGGCTLETRYRRPATKEGKEEVHLIMGPPGPSEKRLVMKMQPNGEIKASFSYDPLHITPGEKKILNTLGFTFPGEPGEIPILDDTRPKRF